MDSFKKPPSSAAAAAAAAAAADAAAADVDLPLRALGVATLRAPEGPAPTAAPIPLPLLLLFGGELETLEAPDDAAAAPETAIAAPAWLRVRCSSRDGWRSIDAAAPAAAAGAANAAPAEAARPAKAADVVGRLDGRHAGSASPASLLPTPSPAGSAKLGSCPEEGTCCMPTIVMTLLPVAALVATDADDGVGAGTTSRPADGPPPLPLPPPPLPAPLLLPLLPAANSWRAAVSPLLPLCAAVVRPPWPLSW